jgi:hypothetical protein
VAEVQLDQTHLVVLELLAKEMLAVHQLMMEVEVEVAPVQPEVTHLHQEQVAQTVAMGPLLQLRVHQ